MIRAAHIFCSILPCGSCDLLKLCSISFVLRSGLDLLLSPSPPSRFVVKCFNFCANVCKRNFSSTFFPSCHVQHYFLPFCCSTVLLAAQHVQFIFCCILGDLHQGQQRHRAIQERKGECWKTALATARSNWAQTNGKVSWTSSSPFEQGPKKITFQLEVWSKSEDVVQTLLQVCTVWTEQRQGNGFHRLRAVFISSSSSAAQSILSGEAGRSDRHGESAAITDTAPER